MTTRFRRVVLLGIIAFAVSSDAMEAGAWVARRAIQPGASEIARRALPTGDGGAIGFGIDSATVSGGSTVIVRYSASGATLWTLHPLGSSDSLGVAMDATLDDSSNVFWTGSSRGGDGTRDIVVGEVDRNGVLRWQQRWSSGSNQESPVAVRRDGAGNVIVAGSSSEDYGPRKLVVLKYSATGVPIWQQEYGAATPDLETALALDIGPSNTIFVSGYRSDSLAAASMLLTKFTSAGALVWAREHAGTVAGETNRAMTVFALPDGGAVIGGFETDSLASGDVVILRHDSNGNLAWRAVYDGPLHDWDTAERVVCDAFQNVYVVGVVSGPDSTYDGILLKYSGAGQLLWKRDLKGAPHGWDELNSIGFSSSQQVIVGGVRSGVGTERDLVVQRYSPAGALLAQWTYDGPLHAMDIALQVAVDPTDAIFVAGVSAGADSAVDWVVVKVDGAELVGVPGGAPLPMALRFGPVQPNPTSGDATIELDLPNAGLITLRVYDVQGREFRAVGLRSRYEPGRHRLPVHTSTLPNGVYFVRASATVDGRTQLRVVRFVVLN